MEEKAISDSWRAGAAGNYEDDGEDGEDGFGFDRTTHYVTSKTDSGTS